MVVGMMEQLSLKAGWKESMDWESVYENAGSKTRCNQSSHQPHLTSQAAARKFILIFGLPGLVNVHVDNVESA